MKHSLPFLLVLVALPGRAHAQLDIILSGSRPEVRAGIGPLILSAGVGGRGIDVRVGARPTGTIGTRAPRRQPTGRTTTRTQPTRRTTTPSPRTTAGRARASASALLATADRYVGTPYVWGGESPRGFDCSGFVQYVFREHGIELPRTSRQQVEVGQVVPLGIGSLRAGDLMFFATGGARIDHIAIYAGDNQIIHSSSSGGGVAYDRLNSKRGRFFTARHVATRRVLAGGFSLVGPLSDALRAFAGFDPPDPGPRR